MGWAGTGTQGRVEARGHAEVAFLPALCLSGT